MTRAWFRDVRAATTRGRCVAYVTTRTALSRHGATCKRQGRWTLTVNNGLPMGPFCRQHALAAQDRATAAAIGTDRLVRLEVIKW